MLLACIGTEERCQEVPTQLVNSVVTELQLFTITDPPSRFSDRALSKTEMNRKALVTSGVIPDVPLRAYPLFALDDEIQSIFAGVVADDTPTELWIDITCMPKRFFFLLVKLALRAAAVRSLYATYAQPAPGRYTPSHLAEDPEIPQPLPGFGPAREEPQKLIVAVGFEALGLAQLLGEYRDRNREILYILPFPPGQPYSRRVWETVLTIGYPGEHRVRRVPAIDTFGTVDQLLVDTVVDEERRASAALAPYGPKPMSLGMCVYATYTNSPCYYTQPRVYHPDYTSGRGGAWGYCLKMDGRATAMRE